MQSNESNDLCYYHYTWYSCSCLSIRVPHSKSIVPSQFCARQTRSPRRTRFSVSVVGPLQPELSLARARLSAALSQDSPLGIFSKNKWRMYRVLGNLKSIVPSATFLRIERTKALACRGSNLKGPFCMTSFEKESLLLSQSRRKGAGTTMVALTS